MAHTQQIEFSAQSLLALLMHYTDGEIPIDAELRFAGVSPYLGSWVGLGVESDKWEGRATADGGIEPLHIRYEGKKILSWGDKQVAPTWLERKK